MAEKKTFIGYDLGDGETITDLAVLDHNSVKDRVQTLFNAMTMPDNNTAGQAIPTVYGYTDDGRIVFSSSILTDPESVRDIRISFKRCPSDLMPSMTEGRRQEILAEMEKGWPSQEACPELYSKKMRGFIDAVVSFTNAIFHDERYKRSIQDASVDSDEIIFCVGHPTRWTPFDIAVYGGILGQSILGTGAYVGKPTSLLMAAESRAAFLYVKDKATSKILEPGTSALLIDVGSSTIDLTAMAADSRNHQYNSGNNYLGARSIDFIIQKWYLEKLRRDEEDWNVYQSLLQMNPAMERALTLSCRRAKEDVYSVAAKKSRILFGDFMPVRISQDDVDKAINETPIGEILTQYVNVPARVTQTMGEKNWKQLFREFLQECKAEMEAQGITISRIIMTGSASKMPFVHEIVHEVFSEVQEDGILADMNPARSISMGLALVGPSNEKSKAFQEDLKALMDNEIDQIISNDVSQLADKLSPVLEEQIVKIVKNRIKEWQSGGIKTLADMSKLIEADCSGENLTTLLVNNQAYQNAIKIWATDIVGHDIAVKLKGICDRYGVGEITVDNLNVMKVSTIKVGGIKINPTDDIMNVLSATISIIAGLVMAAIMPTILAVVIVLISYVSTTIALLLLEALLLMPGIGWAILVGLAGLAAVKLAASGMNEAKKQLADKLQTANLPQWVRDLVKDKKIDQQIEKAKLGKKIRESIVEENSKAQIVSSVKQGLQQQINRCAEEIKYVIESK